MSTNKRIPELSNILSVAVADLMPLYSASGDLTGYVSIQQLKDSVATTPNRGIFAPVATINTLKAIDTTNAAVWYNYGIINVGNLGIFRLDRYSTLTADDNGVVQPTTGSGRWIKDSPVQVSITYDSARTYDNTNNVTEYSYSEYNLKYWRYINATPTSQTERETALGVGNGSPAENVYWEEVSKSDITSLVSGDLSGSLPGPTVIKIQNRAISNAAPSDKDALRWNNTTNQWEPGPNNINGGFNA